jgi:K+-transporting ATPase A subunit
MAPVLRDEKTFLDLVLRPVELLVYGLSGVDPEFEVEWAQYAWHSSFSVGSERSYSALF